MPLFFSSYANAGNCKTGSTSEPSLLYQHVYKPFAVKAVQFLPMWLAPNILTLMGLFLNFAHFLLVVWFVPHFSEEEMRSIPNWLPFVCAVMFFTYMMLDNMDGRQAVRTGAGSTFGELLDHACDAMVMGLSGTVGCAFFQLGPWAAVWFMFFGCWLFYAAHWHEFFTTHLELPKWNGPTEALTLTFLAYLFTSFVGVEFWRVPIGLEVWGTQVTRGYVLAAFTPTAAVFGLIQQIMLILESSRGKASLSTVFAIPLPLVFLYISLSVWVAQTPAIVTQHPHLFLSGAGFAFSFLCIKLIVIRMMQTEREVISLGVWPSFAMTAASLAGYGLNTTVVQIWWVSTLHVLLSLCYEVQDEFCRALNIRLLTITPKKPAHVSPAPKAASSRRRATSPSKSTKKSS